LKGGETERGGSGRKETPKAIGRDKLGERKNKKTEKKKEQGSKSTLHEGARETSKKGGVGEKLRILSLRGGIQENKTGN